MKTMNAVLAGVTLMICGMLAAQAPAGAPKGATGICKDGSYWTGATKSGACTGHKGVQTWYADQAGKAAATTPAAKGASASMPAPAASPAVAARPAPAPAAAPAAMPATATAAKKGPAANATAKAQAAGGGPGLVWVNTDSNVYHCYGGTYYGKTKAGAYMSEADAKAKGARPDHGKACSK